jgi:hypothetical protein
LYTDELRHLQPCTTNSLASRQRRARRLDLPRRGSHLPLTPCPSRRPSSPARAPCTAVLHPPRQPATWRVALSSRSSSPPSTRGASSSSTTSMQTCRSANRCRTGC